jgi:hypothetical protein
LTNTLVLIGEKRVKKFCKIDVRSEMGAWGRRRQPVIRAAIKRPKNMAAQFYSHQRILTEGNS